MAVLSKKHRVAQLLLGYGADVKMLQGKVSVKSYANLVYILLADTVS